MSPPPKDLVVPIQRGLKPPTIVGWTMVVGTMPALGLVTKDKNKELHLCKFMIDVVVLYDLKGL
jgi:hypothetical protein